MLRRIAVLLWLGANLGCPGESASQAAVVKPQVVEVAPKAEEAKAKAEEPGDENCCGAEGPNEVELPAEAPK